MGAPLAVVGRMKVTGPLFKCFGSKWLSSKTLPPPEKALICEPFAGGAGYSLRHCHKKASLFETDLNVYGLWDWLIKRATQQLILDIPVGVPAGTDIRTLGLSDGQSLLLKHWQRTNNVGNCWTISGWGHLPGQWTANTRARIAEEFQAVKHWDVRSSSGVRVIEAQVEDCDITSSDVTWFIDPPYEYNYKYRMRYPINYHRMGRNIRQLKGQIIVCEALHPKSGQYPKWLPFETWEKRITSRRKEGDHKYSSEMLWTNQPSA